MRTAFWPKYFCASGCTTSASKRVIVRAIGQVTMPGRLHGTAPPDIRTGLAMLQWPSPKVPSAWKVAWAAVKSCRQAASGLTNAGGGGGRMIGAGGDEAQAPSMANKPRVTRIRIDKVHPCGATEVLFSATKLPLSPKDYGKRYFDTAPLTVD